MKLSPDVARQQPRFRRRTHQNFLGSIVHKRMLSIQSNDLRLRWKSQPGVFEITNHPDDGHIDRVIDISSWRHLQGLRWSNVDLPPDGIGRWEITPAQFLTDQRDRWI